MTAVAGRNANAGAWFIFLHQHRHRRIQRPRPIREPSCTHKFMNNETCSYSRDGNHVFGQWREVMNDAVTCWENLVMNSISQIKSGVLLAFISVASTGGFRGKNPSTASNSRR